MHIKSVEAPVGVVCMPAQMSLTMVQNYEVGKTGRRRRKREREKEGKRARKRQGLVVLGSEEENSRVLFGDPDQESETRMRKNALRTGRRQAME
ncbi:hypothetical protein TNCV_4734641 [Trichonephila clavipes]|nr:hypothetical protein TNCV_4734641 [Trichonephila clavipes]